MWQERAALRDFKPDYVSLGSKADIGLAGVDVRFTPKADITERDWDVC
jgi:hypothetical protein